MPAEEDSYAIEDVLELYNWKNTSLPYNDYREICTEQFLELVFNTSLMRDDAEDYDLVVPFEKENCKEYQNWKKYGTRSDGDPFVYNSLVLLTTQDDKKHTRILLREQQNRGFSGLIEAGITNNKFAITSPITYVGRRRTAENARYLYALAFDLDGVGKPNMYDLFHQFKNNVIPTPNIIVNSGHGLHLYYLLEKPIPLYKANRPILTKIKNVLTSMIWNKYTSKFQTKQFQSILQGFRIPGSLTKFGKKVVAFYNEEIPRYTLYTMIYGGRFNIQNRFTSEELELIKSTTLRSPDSISREEAKEKYPEWYEWAVENNRKNPRTHIFKRGLYEWWRKKLDNGEILEGHRYFACCMLVSYAVKCGISKEEVAEDIMNLIPSLNSITMESEFTEEDAQHAIDSYNPRLITIPRRTVVSLTGVQITPNKRNGRNHKEHLRRARMLRDIDDADKWRENNGPKEKQSLVLEWQENNPLGTKTECAKELNLAYKTVNKWWNSNSVEIYTERIKEWKQAHPNNMNKSQCARDLELSRTTITKYWNN